MTKILPVLFALIWLISATRADAASSKAPSTVPGTQTTVSHGLTAKGLAKLLSSDSVAKVLANHSIEGLNIEVVGSHETNGFLVTIETSSVGATQNGLTLRPCMISVAALRPEDQPKASYTITTREMCLVAPARPPPQTL